MPLTLGRADAPPPRPEDLPEIVLTGADAEERYVVNYEGYYALCPACLGRYDVPAGGWRRFKALDEPTEDAPTGFLLDLKPCPSCKRPSDNLSVLVDSEVRGAVFLHPGRPEPSPLEQCLHIVDFGTIRLQDWRAEIYRWKPHLERATSASRSTGFLHSFRRKERWRISLQDDNGTFELGTIDLPKPLAGLERGKPIPLPKRRAIRIPLDILDTPSPDVPPPSKASTPPPS